MSEAGPVLRLALVSSGLGRVGRGVETWMAELAAALPAGVDAELWAGGRPPSVPGRRGRLLFAVGRDSWPLRGLSWDKRYAREQQSMLVQTALAVRLYRRNVVYCGDPVLAWHLAKFRRVHGAKVVFMNGMRLGHGWAARFDGVHLLTPGYLAEARREVPAAADRFFAVPHFADPVRFYPPDAAAKRAARSEFRLPTDEYVVLAVGPVGTVSGKRLDFLAAEAARLGPGTRLVSAGADEDGAESVRAAAVAALGDRVTFLGPVPRDRMPTLYRAADVFALGSLAEPFSIAILEALATGLPVIHHRYETTIWVAGRGGIPVAMDVPGRAADALEYLRDDAAAWGRTSTAARELAVERYSPDVVAKDLVRELERILRGA